MPLTDPGREGLEGGQTVYIDGPLDLPSQLMHQELENLVGLSDLETLQDASHSQIINTSGVLLTDGIEQMEDSDEELEMETSNHENNHSMDVDCLSNSTSEIGAELSSLVPIDASLDDGIITDMSTNNTIQKMKEIPLNIIESSVPQNMKTSSSQFVILQPHQNSSFISLGGKLIPAGQIFSSFASTNNNKATINNFTSNSKQFRTIQVKHPSQMPQNSSGVTKVIINNQPSNVHQIKTISQQNNENSIQADSILKVDNKNSTSKMAFQFQPMGLSLGQRNIYHTISKAPENKPSAQLAVPVSFALRPSSNISTVIKQEPNELPIHGITSTSTINSPQKIYIKGSMPFSSIKSGQFICDSPIIKLPSTQISQPQTVQLSNKVNYVRLVNQTASESSTTTNTIVHTIPKVVSLKQQVAPVSTQTLNIKSLSISGSGTNTNSSMANAQGRTSANIALSGSTLPSQVLSNAHAGSLVMIPAHLLQNNSNSNGPSIIQVASQVSPTLPIVSKPQPTKTLIDANGIKSRKPCNCTKSQCLKLYCDCFANGEFCNNCNCNNCFNNLTHEEDRQKAIRSCLERNPNAFRPKIGKGGMENKRRHNKGCNCKRSGCLKNYCECYEAKIPCSRICKCVGCRNVDNCGNFERERLLDIAEAAEAKVNQKIYIQNKAISLSSLPSPAKMMYPSSGKVTHCRINQEVVAATCHCLLAQTEKAARMGVDEKEKELMVINEFSRCLLQIIGCNAKSKD